MNYTVISNNIPPLSVALSANFTLLRALYIVVLITYIPRLIFIAPV